MSLPSIRDGAVVIRGNRIIAIDRWDAVRTTYPNATVFSYPDGVLLPGLVNAHTHLELSDLSVASCEPGVSLPQWLGNIVRTTAATPPTQRVPAAIETGIAECLRFGVTSVGDITSNPAITRPLLARSPLNVVSYGEVLAMGARRGLLEPRMAAAFAPPDSAPTDAASPRFVCGISPHSPYSVERDGYRRCVEAAAARGLPLATHLAESADELPFLRDHAGPLRSLWDRIGGWDDAIPKVAGGPFELAAETGVLDHTPCVLAHANYCTDADLDRLARGRASVAYCPRTHAFFRHPPHRWREMLARGINVAVGTDSRASSPDLNLVDDLRLLHRLAPDFPPHELWTMATTRAAAAIGDACAGHLAPGAWADCAIFPAAGADPLRTVLETVAIPQAVWARGRLVPTRK